MSGELLGEHGVSNASGTVVRTVLLTDIEGSTQLWETYPDEMESAVLEHNRIVTETIENRGGEVLRYTGDGVLAVFDHAPAAVEAAVDVQRHFVTNPRETVGHLRVRIGINTGPCRIEGTEIIGKMPNLASRLEQAAHGNQVLLPSATAEACQGLIADDITITDLGRFSIRGFSEPVRIYTLAARRLPSGFPPLRVPAIELDELPSDDGALFGRDVEVADLVQAVGQHRLVTVWGPHGNGKTRLAVEVARTTRAFANGSKLIDVSSAQSDEDVLAQCVVAVRAQPIGTEGAGETLVRVLGGLQLLLILDGCSRALSGTRTLVELLMTHCPSVHLLVTTQECLRLAQEVTFELGPLEVPSESTVDALVLTRVSSVQLFLERGRRVIPSLQLTTDNARLIASICRAVDGVPLALGLAALRLDVETLDELARALSDLYRDVSAEWMGSLPMINRSAEAGPGLVGIDRLLLAHLSTFVGPFSRELAAQLAASLSSAAELDRLIRRSLVVRHHQQRDRLYVLGPTRATIQMSLAPGERRAVRDAHAEMMIDRADRCGQRMLTSEERAAVAEFRLDFADHRRAMAHLLDTGNDEQAAVLLAKLFVFCLFQPNPEAFAWARVLSVRLPTSSLLVTDTLGAAAIGAWFSGDLESSMALSHRALQLADGTVASTIWARTALVDALAFAGRLDELPVHFVGLVNELRARPEPFWQVNGLGFEALGLATIGEINAGRMQADRALAVARRIDNPDCVGWALHALGRVMARTDPELAAAAFESAVEAFRTVGSRLNMAPAIAEWTHLKLRAGDRRAAGSGVLELLDLLVVSGNRAHLSQALRLAALLLADAGRREAAALVLLSRRELPEMPASPVDHLSDEALLDELRGELGRAWPSLRVRAMATPEEELVAFVLKTVGTLVE